MVEISVVTPSFNEEGNIKGVVGRTSKALDGVEHEIIVEDDSTDKTPDIVKSIEGDYPVRLFHRDENKLKLAPAVVHGIENSQGEYVCIIDSDLQHPPEKIPELLKRAQETDADVVVGSRYVPGGSAEGLGSPIRKLVSIATKLVAQILIDPTRKTTDPTAGFFLFKRDLVKGVKLDPIGYKILIEVLARTNPNKVEDVPYKFVTRTENISKSTFAQGILVLKHLAKLFFELPYLGRFIKFGLVGASGVIVNLGILTICKELFGLHKDISSGIGIVISIFTNFLLNYFFTWRDLKATSVGEWTKKVALYYIGSGIGAGITFAIFKLGTDSLGINYQISQLVGILVAMITNFIFSNLVVWRQKPQKKN